MQLMENGASPHFEKSLLQVRGLVVLLLSRAVGAGNSSEVGDDLLVLDQLLKQGD